MGDEYKGFLYLSHVIYLFIYSYFLIFENVNYIINKCILQINHFIFLINILVLFKFVKKHKIKSLSI